MSTYVNSDLEDNYSRMREYLRLMQADYSESEDFNIFAAYLVAVYLEETGIETNLKTAILQSLAVELGCADRICTRQCAEFPKAYAKAAYEAGTEEFVKNTAAFIKLVEKHILSLFDFPEITGTADRCIDDLTRHIQALQEHEKQTRLNEEKYLTAVELASGDDILKLQKCIDIFDELGNWKDSASLRENCVNRVLQQLSEKNIEEEKSHKPSNFRNSPASQNVRAKKSRLPAVIAAAAALALGIAFLIFMTSEIPDIPDGTAEFFYDGNGNEIDSYGEYCACIYDGELVFGYVTYIIYKGIDPIEEFAAAGAVCSDREIQNMFNKRSIEFDDGTKGWISYDDKTNEMRICYKNRTYLCKEYSIDESEIIK